VNKPKGGSRKAHEGVPPSAVSASFLRVPEPRKPSGRLAGGRRAGAWTIRGTHSVLSNLS